MADPVTAMAAGGVGISMVSQVISGNAKAEAAHQDAANKRLQANEVLKAGKREEDLLQIQGQRASGEALQAVAASGSSLSGTSLLAMEDMARQVNAQDAAIKENATFRSDQLNKSADIEDQQGDVASETGYLNALASGMQAGAKGYSMYQPNDGTTMSVGALKPSASVRYTSGGGL